MKRLTCLFLLMTSLTTLDVYAAPCVDWGKAMTLYNIKIMPKGRKTVVVQSFEDYTRHGGDEWLSVGIARLFADFLSAGKDISVLTGPIVNYHPDTVNPAYTITGMYQHLDDRVRVFVKFLERGELKQQYELYINHPHNKQFFDAIADTSWTILGIISPRYEREQFEQTRVRTPIVPAYENYIRGLTAYYSFDPERMDVAKTWFEESKKADVNFLMAYQGLADVYIFQGLYNKQIKKPFAVFFEQAEKELMTMEKFTARQPPPQRTRKYVIKVREIQRREGNRYLLGNAAYISGLSAEGKDRWMEAAKYYEETIRFVPEDAMAWYKLSQMRERTGDAFKASEARAKAYELNSCVQ